MYVMQKRSIALCIILTFVTCGLYSYYWLYKMAEDINYVKNDPNATTPGMVLIFSILTCGIYTLYWLYKSGEVVDAVRVQQGMLPGSKAILYLLLSVFGLSIVSFSLLQNDLNEMAVGMGGYGTDTSANNNYSYQQTYGQQSYGQQTYGQQSIPQTNTMANDTSFAKPEPEPVPVTVPESKPMTVPESMQQFEEPSAAAMEEAADALNNVVTENPFEDTGV